MSNMSGAGDTLQLAARFVAETLRPFLSSVGSDGEIAAFVEQLGWSLPQPSPSIAALGESGGEMLDALTAVMVAEDAVQDGTGDDDAVTQALGALVLRVLEFAARAADTRSGLAAELPPAFVAATGIADAFAARLFTDLAVRELEDRAGLTMAICALLGVVERAEVGADPARFQPDYTRRDVRFDRVAPLVSDPGAVLRDVYGWGTPTLDVDLLFENVRSLSFQLLAPVELRCPSDALLAAVAPDAPVAPDDDAPLAFVLPLYEDGPVTVVLAVIPLPKATPEELQGLAITLQLQLGDSAELDLGPGLALTLDGTLDLSSGVAAVVRPDRDPAIIVAPEAGSPAAASGRGGARLTYGDPDEPTRVLTAPGGSFLEAKQVYLAAGVDATHAAPDVYLEAGLSSGTLTIGAEDADGFLAAILPADGVTAHLDLGLAWSLRGGLRFSGAAGLRATYPLNLSLGPLAVRSITAALAADGDGLSLALGVDGEASLGPVTAAVSGLGVLARTGFHAGNLGPVDLEIGFKGPDGIGLSVEAAVLTGGGLLLHDEAQGLYAGAMQLSLQDDLTLTAYGLIATRMPDGRPGYSLLVFITAEGFHPVPLGFGFVLQRIGGMVGVNRTFDQDAIKAGLATDTLATLLFPRDPVGNAPALIQALAAAFPARPGSYLLGLLAQVTWFTPTLVTIDLALVLELGARTRLLALARVSSLLPTREDDLIRLQMDALGVLDLDEGTLSADAVLVDSRLVHQFPITGSAALRARWAGDGGAYFVLAVGGLDPRFAPPAGFPPLERVAIALCAGTNPRLLCDAYLAVTANTVQFGSRTSLYAEALGFSVVGDLGFDALVTLLPPHFIVDFHASVQLKRGSHNLFKVSLDGTLEGPLPLRLAAKATFEILWISFSVHFDFTLAAGDLADAALAAVDVAAELTKALADPASWSTRRPPALGHGVALRGLPASAPLVLDPLGQLVVRQQVAPLDAGRDVDVYDGAPVTGPRRFRLEASLGGQAGAPVAAGFAPARYFAMSDDEKLAAPSFETMGAGLVLGAEAAAFDAATIVPAPLEYEAIVLAPATPGAAEPPDAAPSRYGLPVEALQAQWPGGAAARAPARQVGRARFRNPAAAPAARLAEPAWRIVRASDGAVSPADPGVTTWSAYRAALAALNRGGARYLMAPAHELAA